MRRKQQREREARMHESACIWSDKPVSNYESYKFGAEWADSTMIDKACEWLERALPLRPDDRDEFIEQFKQAMEGE